VLSARHASATPAPSLPELMRRLAQLAALAQQRIRQRRALARLDARLLRDIGVSPEQARRETAKPFWRE
jgi:uncharacterized protein YjiS (DUF1127 family)